MHIRAESSLIAKLKLMTLVELNKLVVDKNIEVFSREGDGLLRY